MVSAVALGLKNASPTDSPPNTELADAFETILTQDAAGMAVETVGPHAMFTREPSFPISRFSSAIVILP
jgi:hypothetical protein